MSSQGEQKLFSFKILDNLHSKIIETLIDNIPEYVYIKDKELKFLKINPKTAEALGLKNPNEAIGKSDFDFLPKDQANQAYEDDVKVLKTGQPIINKMERITDADCNDHWFSVTKVPRYNSDSEIIGTIGISRDVTDWMIQQQQG